MVCFRKTHELGGLCIADELQSGLGRLGSSWWAYQHLEIDPDMIIVGKGLGNGIPLTALGVVQKVESIINKDMKKVCNLVK